MRKPTLALFILSLLFIFACQSQTKTDSLPTNESVEAPQQKAPDFIKCPVGTKYYTEYDAREGGLTFHFCVNDAGKPNGPAIIIFEETGVPKIMGQFKNGYKHGKWHEWDKANKLKVITNFDEKGQRTGLYVEWNPKGSDFIVGEYQNGVLVDNVLFNFDEKGHLVGIYQSDANQNLHFTPLEQTNADKNTITKIETKVAEILLNEMQEIPEFKK